MVEFVVRHEFRLGFEKPMSMGVFKSLLQRFRPALNQSEFTREVESYISNLGEAWCGHLVEPLVVEVSRHGGEPVQINLQNAYLQYLKNRGARQEIISRYVNALLTVEDRLLPKDIIPVIKDKAFVTETLTHLRQKGKDTADFFTTEEYNEELVIVYAVDSAESIRYLNPSSVAEIDLQGETLRSLAVNNLRRILPSVEVHGAAPFFSLKAGGMFESSLLLLDRVWNKAELQIEGEIVVALPARDTLLVADSHSPASIEQIRKVATEVVRSAAYRLTDQLFVRQGTLFIPFEQ